MTDSATTLQPKANPATALTCPSCGVPRGWRVHSVQVPDYLSDKRFDLYACNGCGLVITHPMPAEDDMAWHYPPRYRGNRHGFTGAMRVRLRAKAIEKHFARGFRGRLLDVGAGSGAFALAMKARGWDVCATEIDPIAVARLRDAGIDAKTPADAERDGFAGGAFDAVTCWHVLEHVHRPFEVSQWVAGLLTPVGVFQATVPDVSCWQAKLFGNDWLHLDVPRHLYHFAPHNLRQLLKRAGLDVFHQSCVAIEYDWLGVIQSALNRVCTRQNYLFEKLMGTARLEQAVSFGDVALTYLLTPPLAAVALPAVLAGGVLKNGATLTVTCRGKPQPAMNEGST